MFYEAISFFCIFSLSCFLFSRDFWLSGLFYGPLFWISDCIYFFRGSICKKGVSDLVGNHQDMYIPYFMVFTLRVGAMNACIFIHIVK